ncbi:MAG: relaxase/mobilization nuclease domain-containing protein [Caulobacterales bacterium]|nr:relaxase/mobilization nuclease domain-containing protein [Caulobacterales bacterium]MCA0372236.1 relaxase/mobilization nuclease domain-containing protein [Pseudomonadota bacterium]
MIAKRAIKKVNTSSIAVLTGYIAGLPETRQPQDWPPLINYITDAVSDGARVDFVRVTNLPSEELRDAVLAMMITQDMNTRSKTDKTYHMIFSFPHGEKPSRVILNDIEDNLVASIGLSEHQRISAAHDDKDHYHVHIAINKVHPKTYRNVEPFYDKNALMRTCVELEKKHGLMVTNHGELARSELVLAQSNNNSLDFEVHNNIESLQSWIKTSAKEQLLEAFETSKSWGEFHYKANELGLEFKLRGAGIVIKAVGQEVAVKASSVDRGLSYKALISKLGEFKPAQTSQKLIPTKSYSKTPKINNEISASLFAKFQSNRLQSIAHRREAKAKLNERSELAARVIKEAFLNKKSLVKNNHILSRLNKKSEYQKLAIEQTRVWQVHKNTFSNDKKKIEKDIPLYTWPEFLKNQVAQGDENALEVLRAHEKSKEKFIGNILKCDDIHEAKNIILKDMSPIVRRNGDIIYFIKDGGKVLDTGKALNVETVTTGSAFLALSLAQEKFAGKGLRVNGSDAFKRELIMVAASKDIVVRFADKELNDAVAILKAEKSQKKLIQPKIDRHQTIKPKIKPRNRGR